MASFLEAIFPRLTQDNYSVTSQPTKRYNCIAWAAGQDAKWWWPGPDLEFEYWPENATREETLDAFQEAFASVGYAICQGADFEPGFEKVALFADEAPPQRRISFCGSPRPPSGGGFRQLSATRR